MTAEKGLSYNIAPLVGHGTIKVGVMGFETRKPTAQEMQKMIDLLVRELDRGLYGLSTGLEYEPGSYTTNEELVELCKVVKDYGGIYTTHMKNEGRYVLESIDQALEVADKSGVSLEISHLKAQYRPNWGKVKMALEKIDKASKSGINVDFDQYPYIAFGSGLIDLIPPWAKAQGASKMVELLKANSVRARVIEDMKKDHKDWENPMVGSSWEDIKIAMLKTEKNKKYEGKNLAQIAEDMEVSPYDAVIDLLIQTEKSRTVKRRLHGRYNYFRQRQHHRRGYFRQPASVSERNRIRHSKRKDSHIQRRTHWPASRKSIKEKCRLIFTENPLSWGILCF